MARRPLKPQLNQIRAWVREGRTDAWIAHQLEVGVSDIKAFKREHDLAPAEEGFTEEVDLRAEDDALIAAELDAEPEPVEPEEDEGGGDEDGERPRRRRRGRRGGRGRARPPLEGTFDHGEEGYGLWLDPAVQDDPIYAEHWAGHRTLAVTIEPDRIVLRRSGGADAAGDEAPGADAE